MSSKPYLPYGSIGLKQSGKNLFDDAKVSVMTLCSYSNGIYSARDNDTATTLVYKIQQYDNDRKYISLAGEIKQNIDKPGIYYFTAQKYTTTKYLKIGNNGATKEFQLFYPLDDINVGDYYTVVINIIDATIGASKFKDVMLLKGKITSASYESYHEPKVISINLNGNTLAKVGDIKDKLIIHRNGEVEIEKSVGKINLKDITLWYQDKELSNSNRFYTNEIIYANSNLTLSNYFKYSNIQNINTVDEQGLCAANNRQIALRINKTLVTNVNELKQWLLEHDVEVYYQLTTSEVIKLPSINPIELWEGTNIFKLITNLETNFEVEYVVDKDSVLDEVQTAMLNAEIEI